MCYLICDVITCDFWSCDVGKINVYDKIMIENHEKKRKYGNKFFYINLDLKYDLGMVFLQLAKAIWCQMADIIPLAGFYTI